MEQAVIPVVLACNDNYAPYCSVAIQSVRDAAKSGNPYHIYVLEDALSSENIAALEGMSQGDFRVTCRNVANLIALDVMYATGHYPREMYYRILIPELFPQYEKIIYLDCDVIVERDLGELFACDLGHCAVGAVHCQFDRLSRRQTRKVPELSSDEYFNSGVLVIGCAQFRAQQIKDRCYAILTEKKGLWFPDQDALNLACAGSVCWLDSRWNYQWCAATRWREADEVVWLPGQGILHYTSEYKPWNCTAGKIALPFWRSASRCPYAAQIMEEYERREDDKIQPFFLKKTWVAACRDRTISRYGFLMCSWRALGKPRRK